MIWSVNDAKGKQERQCQAGRATPVEAPRTTERGRGMTEAGEGGRSLWSMMKILVLNVESSKNPLSGF